jgi:hypothetical protein
MTMRTITSLFDAYDDAAQSVRELDNAGIPRDDISMIASSLDDRLSHTDTANAATGGSSGGALGGGAGLLAGLGMLAIPGVGPVVAAGWLVATAVGAGAGAVAGGLIGSLTDAGVSEDDSHVYLEGVRRGGTLVTARVGDDLVSMAEQIMHRHHPVDPDLREKAYRAQGWTAFDGTAKPYTAAELQQEPAIHRVYESH